MPGIIDELIESPRGTPGIELTRHWQVWDTDNFNEVQTLAAGVVSAIFQGLFFDPTGFQITPSGFRNWEVEAKYILPEPASDNPTDPDQPGNEPDQDTPEYSFDTSGGTIKLTQSRKTISVNKRNVAPIPANADFQGVIGLGPDGDIAGVDVVEPVFNWTETHYLTDSAVNTHLRGRGSIFLATGCTNIAAWRGFQAGEVLFLGASGSKKGSEKWQVTYKFAANPNNPAYRVENNAGMLVIPAFEKKGWEYVWFVYGDKQEGVLVKTPLFAIVERVYREANFADLRIGS